VTLGRRSWGGAQAVEGGYADDRSGVLNSAGRIPAKIALTEVRQGINTLGDGEAVKIIVKP